VVSVDCDDEGPIPAALAKAAGARFLYLLPSFQNPSGRCIGDAGAQSAILWTSHIDGIWRW